MTWNQWWQDVTIESLRQERDALQVRLADLMARIAALEAALAEAKARGCEVCGHVRGQQQTGPRNPWQIKIEKAEQALAERTRERDEDRAAIGDVDYKEFDGAKWWCRLCDGAATHDPDAIPHAPGCWAVMHAAAIQRATEEKGK